VSHFHASLRLVVRIGYLDLVSVFHYLAFVLPLIAATGSGAAEGRTERIDPAIAAATARPQ